MFIIGELTNLTPMKSAVAREYIISDIFIPSRINFSYNASVINGAKRTEKEIIEYIVDAASEEKPKCSVVYVGIQKVIEEDAISLRELINI